MRLDPFVFDSFHKLSERPSVAAWPGLSKIRFAVVIPDCGCVSHFGIRFFGDSQLFGDRCLLRVLVVPFSFNRAVSCCHFRCFRDFRPFYRASGIVLLGAVSFISAAPAPILFLFVDVDFVLWKPFQGFSWSAPSARFPTLHLSLGFLGLIPFVVLFSTAL